MVDYHLHTYYSADSVMPPRALLEAASAAGLTEIAVTDHLDFGHPDRMYIPRFDNREAALARAEANYPHLAVRRGVEVGYIPHTLEQTKQLLAGREWDFVLYSLHVCDGIDPYERVFFEGRTRQAAYGRYLECVLEAVEAWDGYDVLAHLSYVAKRAPYPDAALRYDEFPSLIDAILRRVIAGDHGLELNTSGYANGGAPLPGGDILRRFRELGGRKVTVGSDAHDPQRVGGNGKEAMQVLSDAGFDTVTCYCRRQPYFVPLG